MTRKQARQNITRTNNYLKKLLTTKDFNKYSKEKLENMIVFGERKWRETFDMQRAYN